MSNEMRAVRFDRSPRGKVVCPLCRASWWPQQVTAYDLKTGRWYWVEGSCNRASAHTQVPHFKCDCGKWVTSLNRHMAQQRARGHFDCGFIEPEPESEDGLPEDPAEWLASLGGQP